jgi:hypothetical protein
MSPAARWGRGGQVGVDVGVGIEVVAVPELGAAGGGQAGLHQRALVGGQAEPARSSRPGLCAPPCCVPAQTSARRRGRAARGGWPGAGRAGTREFPAPTPRRLCPGRREPGGRSAPWRPPPRIPAWNKAKHSGSSPARRAMRTSPSARWRDTVAFQHSRRWWTHTPPRWPRPPGTLRAVFSGARLLRGDVRGCGRRTVWRPIRRGWSRRTWRRSF